MPISSPVAHQQWRELAAAAAARLRAGGGSFAAHTGQSPPLLPGTGSTPHIHSPSASHGLNLCQKSGRRKRGIAGSLLLGCFARSHPTGVTSIRWFLRLALQRSLCNSKLGTYTHLLVRVEWSCHAVHEMQHLKHPMSIISCVRKWRNLPK